MLRTLKCLTARVRAFFSVDRLDRDFEAELESHVAMLTEDNIRRGMAAEEARRAALIHVGGLGSIRQQHRDARGLPGVAIPESSTVPFRETCCPAHRSSR
jgi:hypothetical protein